MTGGNSAVTLKAYVPASACCFFVRASGFCTHDSSTCSTINLQQYQVDTIQYNTIQYNTIQYNTIQYNTIQYNTIQYNTKKTDKKTTSATLNFGHYMSTSRQTRPVVKGSPSSNRTPPRPSKIHSAWWVRI